MTNEEKYKGKMYHTESFALRNGGAGEYTYTFYYEAKDADKPAYLRIESLSKSCMLKVNEFKAAKRERAGRVCVPAEHGQLPEADLNRIE